MLFWLFVIILIIGIAIIVIANKLYDNKYDKNGKRKNGFFYDNCLEIETAGIFVTVISGVVVVIMIFILCFQYIGVDARVEEDKEIYNAIEYKVTSGSCRDEFGLLSKEVIDEVQNWNKDVKYRQAVQDDFWIGIFYPDVFDQFETIDYMSYNTGN